MTAYDAAMIGVVVLGMIWGAWRGITWQIASIASLVLGYAVSHSTSAQAAKYFPGEPVVARALAMLAIYVAVSAAIFGVAWLVRATLRQLKFEAYDRHLGMVLGGLEGALLGVVVTLFVVSLAPQSRGPIFASPSGKLVGKLMASVGPALPGEVRTVLTPFWSGEGPAPAAGSVAASASTPAESLGTLLDAGRDELKRAAGRAVEDQIEELGSTHGRDARRR